MARYAIAFDLDTVAMRNDGLTDSDITRIYQIEIPSAFRLCGFTEHLQGSLYHTQDTDNALSALMGLQQIMKSKALNFCKYVKAAHVFRMEEWSDVTALLMDRGSAASEKGCKPPTMRDED